MTHETVLEKILAGCAVCLTRFSGGLVGIGCLGIVNNSVFFHHRSTCGIQTFSER